MKFSKLEASYIRRFSKLIASEAEPSFFEMVKLSVLPWALILGLVVLGALFFIESGWPHFGFALLGFGIGGVLRDIGWFRKSIQLWPLQKQLVNVSRLKELHAELEVAQSK